MKSILLTAGGLLQVILIIFHIWLGFEIDKSLTLSSGNLALMQTFNIATTVMIFFFVYVSLFRKNDLLNTKLGNSLMVFIMIIFMIRGIREFTFPSPSVLISIFNFFIALIYILPLVMPRYGSLAEKKR